MMSLKLERADQAQLDGKRGPARALAMSLLVQVAQAVGAQKLIDVTQAHLVGSYHSGPANIALISKLAELGARVVIPTTLNASSADRQQPQLYPPESPDTKGNCQIVKLYQQMGCRAELTCAPYHLPQRPRRGENIAWAESNAVVFANSVIGARTNMTYQYLDLCAALTGRMPLFGLYRPEQRAGQFLYKLVGIPEHWLQDDAFYQLLGFVVGASAGTNIPVLDNLPLATTEDQLRSLGAAAAAAGPVSMFHAVGITPEAGSLSEAFQHRQPLRQIDVTAADIVSAKRQLSGSPQQEFTTVCLGTPHFSMLEFGKLLDALAGRNIAPNVHFYVSTSRHVMKQLEMENLFVQLQRAGIKIIVDTCTYYGELLKNGGAHILTSSAKWAYYAPGNLGVKVTFARLKDCVDAAITGNFVPEEGFWDA